MNEYGSSSLTDWSLEPRRAKHTPTNKPINRQQHAPPPMIAYNIQPRPSSLEDTSRALSGATTVLVTVFEGCAMVGDAVGESVSLTDGGDATSADIDALVMPLPLLVDIIGVGGTGVAGTGVGADVGQFNGICSISMPN